MAKYYTIPIQWDSGKGRTMETVQRLVVACVWEGGKGWLGRTQGIYRAVKIPYMILVQTYKMHTIKSEP